MKIIGYKPTTYNFKDKASGRQVNSSGYTIHMACPFTPNVGAGYQTEALYFSNDKLDGYVPQLDDEVEVYYNRYGKPARLVVLAQ